MTLPSGQLTICDMKLTNVLLASLLVGCGGFAGSIARYGMSVLGQRFSVDWPIGTLATNILGCIFVGVITEVALAGEMLSPGMRLLLATGFCGGFTTLSSMIYETIAMFRDSEYLHAAIYMGGSIIFSVAAFLVGVLAVRILIRTGGGLWN